MLEVLLLIRGVDADEDMVVGDLVDQDVVNESAVIVEQAGVLRLTLLEARDIVGGEEVGAADGFGSQDFDLAHVADIEQADGFPYGVVLVDEAGVLDGHVPSAEVDHFGAEGAMYGIERRGFERRSP